MSMRWKRRREALLRAGVWVFLVIFALSVVGIAVVTVTPQR